MQGTTLQIMRQGDRALTTLGLGDGRLASVPLLRTLRRMWSDRSLYLFLLPAAAVTIIFAYMPMYGVLMSFQNYSITKGIWGSDFVGLANFREFLRRPEFYRSVRNTLGLSVLNLTITFPLPIVFAIAISEMGGARFKKVVQSITYLPHFVSWVIVAGLLYRLFSADDGVVNLVLHGLGLTKVPFFRDPRYFWGIFTASCVWKDMGWNAIIFLSAITAINPELFEAALVDGAGRMRRIWSITLPGILPTVTILLIFTISAFFSGSGAFEPVMAMRNAMIADRSDIIDVFSYFKGIRNGEYGFAASIGLTQAAISVFLLLSANAGLKKWWGHSLF